jgi:hypothetical protein
MKEIHFVPEKNSISKDSKQVNACKKLYLKFAVSEILVVAIHVEEEKKLHRETDVIKHQRIQVYPILFRSQDPTGHFKKENGQ